MNTQWKSTIGNLRTYQGDIVHVISESEYWNEAKVVFASPKENQPTGIFTVGLPRVKKTAAQLRREKLWKECQ